MWNKKVNSHKNNVTYLLKKMEEQVYREDICLKCKNESEFEILTRREFDHVKNDNVSTMTPYVLSAAVKSCTV